jgi:AraC family ethanolamine operon transcriptional activator
MLDRNSLIQRSIAHDIDLQSAMLEGWHQEYQQLSRGRFFGSLSRLRQGDMTIVEEYTNQSLHQLVAPPGSHLVFGQIAECAHPVYLDGKELLPGKLLVLEGGRSYDLSTRGVTRLTGIALEREALEQTFAEQGMAAIEEAIVSKILDPDPDAAILFSRLDALLSHLFKREGDAPLARNCPDLVRSLALQGIAKALAKTASGRCAEAGRRSVERQRRTVRRAIEFMRCNLACEISINDICAAAHVSQRTLQYYFGNCLQVSPQQYLKALRLNVARRLLMQGGTFRGGSGVRIETIADIAAECGFSHASRFSGEFRELFEELPSTLVKTVQGKCIVGDH